MRQFPLMLFLIVPSLCLSADRFLLSSELRTNFSENGSTTQFLTGYTYDANGNRVQSRVWNGMDSVVAAMSTDKLTYDGTGKVTEELLLSGTDTSSIVRYAYDSGRLVAVRTLTKAGVLRFTDSLVYDGMGHTIEEQRISSAGVKTYFHRYTLNASGKSIADSMYELVSASYSATQADLFTYNTDSTVATQVHWQVSGGSWYCINTAFMRYASGSLVSVATHERDGVGTGMTDSLAYTYDANGNRSKEEEYDGTKTLKHRIVYTWRDTQPQTIALMNGRLNCDQRFALSAGQGHLNALLPSQNQGTITIFDMTGKRLYREVVDHSGIVPLQGIGKGSFIAVFTSGTNKQALNFTNYN